MNVQSVYQSVLIFLPLEICCRNTIKYLSTKGSCAHSGGAAAPAWAGAAATMQLPAPVSSAFLKPEVVEIRWGEADV